MSERWDLNVMMQRAARGLGKVDRDGPRGATLVTQQEVEAMAGTLALFGLVPIPPGAPVPETLMVENEEPDT